MVVITLVHVIFLFGLARTKIMLSSKCYCGAFSAISWISNFCCRIQPLAYQMKLKTVKSLHMITSQGKLPNSFLHTNKLDYLWRGTVWVAHLQLYMGPCCTTMERLKSQTDWLQFIHLGSQELETKPLQTMPIANSDVATNELYTAMILSHGYHLITRCLSSSTLENAIIMITGIMELYALSIPLLHIS